MPTREWNVSILQSTTTEAAPQVDDDQRYDLCEDLERMIEQAAHLLPAQGPITAFVHHNTLHAFENLPFEKAAVRGAKTFGCHPYLPEDRYRQMLARGRIRPVDIDAVLIDDLGDRADQFLGLLGTRFHLHRAMLQYALRTGPTAELRWVVAETDALREFREETPPSVRDNMVERTRRWAMRDLCGVGPVSRSDAEIRQLTDIVFERFDRRNFEAWEESRWQAFTLHLLWLVCHHGVSKLEPHEEAGTSSVRHRDYLLAATGEDTDQLVDDNLIRFCAAFLDQGFSPWPLPNRGAGFYRSFLDYVAQPFGSPERWLRGLRHEAQRLRSENVTPMASIIDSLRELGVEAGEREAFITETLLALRGFAGMIWQTETRGDRVARPTPQGSLVEFLAVRLILERFALAFTARTALKYGGPLSKLRDTAQARIPKHETNSVDQRTFLVFQLAQPLGWSPENLYRLTADGWASLVEEIEAFSGLERRRIYHLAFERCYRNQTLDAVVAHGRRLGPPSEAPRKRGRSFKSSAASTNAKSRFAGIWKSWNRNVKRLARLASLESPCIIAARPMPILHPFVR